MNGPTWNRPIASAMSKFARDSHKSVARDLGHVLTLDDEAAWDGFALVLMARLSDRQRAALAWAALLSLSPDQARVVADGVTREGEDSNLHLDLLDFAVFREAVAEYRAARSRWMAA